MEELQEPGSKGKDANDEINPPPRKYIEKLHLISSLVTARASHRKNYVF